MNIKENDNSNANTNIKKDINDNNKIPKNNNYLNNKSKNKEKLIIKVKKEDDENEKENKIKEQEIINNEINKNNLLSIKVSKSNKISMPYETKKQEKEKEEIENEISKKKKNIEIIKTKNKELQEQFNKLLTELKNGENNIYEERLKYDKIINGLNKDIKKKGLIIKNSVNNISKLNQQINSKCNILFDSNRIIKENAKNKINLLSDSKNGNLSEKIERIIKLKEYQNNNSIKMGLLLKKEISNYNKKIFDNKIIDKNIKKENPSIVRKEEELGFILNKLNQEMELIKCEITYLRNIEYKHNIICKKIKEKLLKELDYKKLDKSKKLESIELIQKMKYIKELKKQKIINRKKNIIINSSSYKVMQNNSNAHIINNILQIRKSNSSKDIEKNKNNNLINNSEIINKEKIEKINLALSPNLSAFNDTNCKTARNYNNDKNNELLFIGISHNNMYEYAKKIIKKNIHKNKSKSMEKIKNSYGLISNNLFTEEEKFILKNYNFIPEKNISNYELKYKKKIEKIKNLEHQIKKYNKIKDENKLKIDLLMQDNNKKQENIEVKNKELYHMMKINENKISKIKALIKQKIQEYNKYQLKLKNRELINQKLKLHINLSNDIQNMPLNEDESKIQNLFNRQVNLCENNDNNQDDKGNVRKENKKENEKEKNISNKDLGNYNLLEEKSINNKEKINSNLINSFKNNVKNLDSNSYNKNETKSKDEDKINNENNISKNNNIKEDNNEDINKSNNLSENHMED